ncbi:MAG: hypothetical protein WCW33_01975 [Candidatus Babeliales bacterium]|jgi:hypothetical protein
MTRQNFLLMLLAAGVGLLGVYTLAAKPRVPATGIHTVQYLYNTIRATDNRADFILAAKDIATSDQQRRGIHIYEPMTAAECVSKPSLIAGSVSPNKAIKANDPLKPVFDQIKNILEDNKSTNVTLQTNTPLLNVLANRLFLNDKLSNGKPNTIVQAFVKKTTGRTMTKAQLVQKYGEMLLSFDLGGYRFFLVDPCPPKAYATGKSVTYPVLTAVMMNWQW